MLRRTQEGEAKWHAMIKDRAEVDQDEFESNCDLSMLLEDDEPLDEFIGADPTSYFAKSHWGNVTCYFVMTAGFEFIFTAQ